MSRVFVTGDTHGSIDIGKLSSFNFPEGRTLTRGDYLVICGDFGLVWSDPPSLNAEYWLDWLEERLDRTRLKRWYSGHHHGDFQLGDERHAMLYQQVVELGDMPDETPYSYEL